LFEPTLWIWKTHSCFRVIHKVTLSLGLLSPPYPLFQWYPQSKEILLNLSMNCWNSAFNAEGSRLIILVVQVGAVKIYVAAVVEAIRKKKERQDETQFITKIGRKTSFGSQLFCFVRFSFPVKVFHGLLCRHWPFSPP
jgi:hypothetical protein